MVMGSTYPRSATALGGIYVWQDGREHTDTFHALLDYPEQFLFSWGMGLGNGAGSHYTVHGEHGTIDLETMTVSDAGGRERNPALKGNLESPPDANHMANWIDCMRSREKPNADILFGHQHSVATIMAAAALETGQRMRYDPEARRIQPG
jgi:predicted dehydrogenase